MCVLGEKEEEEEEAAAANANNDPLGLGVWEREGNEIKRRGPTE